HVASRPAEKHVERVREQQLGGDQMRRVVHLAPVPAPVDEQRPLDARLQVMLFAQHDLDAQRSPTTYRRCEECRIPRKQQHSNARERPRQRRVLPDGIEKQESTETECEGKGKRKNTRVGRTLGYGSFEYY